MAQNFKIFLYHDGQDIPSVNCLAEHLEKNRFSVLLDVWEINRRLRENLENYFKKEELCDICFDFGIKDENFPDTLSGIARGLLEQCELRGRTDELIEYCKNKRLNAQWDNLSDFTLNKLEAINLVLILIGKGTKDFSTLKSCLSESENRKIPVILVILPGSKNLPNNVVSTFEQIPKVNLQNGIEKGMSLLILEITGGKSVSVPIELSKALVVEVTESRAKTLIQQKVDAWGIASLKKRLQALSEIVAQESAEEALQASETYKYDVLTMLIPLMVTLRWHRGYASGLENLLNIPPPQKQLSNFECREVSPPCLVMEGVLSAEKNDPNQVLIRVSGHPAVIVCNLSYEEVQTISYTINQYGRLGVPKVGGLSILQRIGDIPIRDQLDNLDKLAVALFRNREALIPLIVRWGMPGAEWLLPDESLNIEKNVIESNLLGKSKPNIKPLGISKDVVIEEDFIASRAIQPVNAQQQYSNQEAQDMFDIFERLA